MYTKWQKHVRVHVHHLKNWNTYIIFSWLYIELYRLVHKGPWKHSCIFFRVLHVYMCIAIFNLKIHDTTYVINELKQQIESTYCGRVSSGWILRWDFRTLKTIKAYKATQTGHCIKKTRLEKLLRKIFNKTLLST